MGLGTAVATVPLPRPVRRALRPVHDVRTRGRPLKTFKNAFWLSSGRALADLSSVVFFTVLSRALGPAGVGEYAYGFAFGNLIGLAACSGYEEYGIRELACAEPARARQAWERILSAQAMQLVLALVLLAAVTLLAGGGRSRGAVMVELGLFFIGWLAARTAFMPSMAQQAMRTPALTELACRTSAVLAAIVLVVFATASLPLILIGFPIAGLAMAGLALRNAARRGFAPRLNPSWRALRETLRGTAAFAITDLLGIFYSRIDVLIIVWWLGTPAAGLYALGVKLVEVGLLPLFYSGAAAYPLISRLAAVRSPRFERAARDLMQLVLLLSGWLALGIAVLAPLAVVPVFGERFAPAAPLLGWFALLALAKGIEVPLYRLLYCVRRQSWYARSIAVGTGVIAALNCALIPLAGIRGAVMAAIFSTLLVDGACVYGLRRELPPRTVALVLLRFALALATSWAAGLAVLGLGAAPWLRGLAVCGVFPLAAWGTGLIPELRTSPLVSRREGDGLGTLAGTLGSRD